MLVVGIPSGQRLEQCKAVIKAWRDQPVKIALLTWDSSYIDLYDQVDYYIAQPSRYSYAKNHNYTAKLTADEGWNGYICGADDLYPGSNIDKLEDVCIQRSNELIWVFDGLNPSIMTHPIVTRGYYEKKGYIFDEQFVHNFCDTDLLVREWRNTIRVVGVTFDHRWYRSGDDEIYAIGRKSFEADKQRFIAKHGDKDVQIRIQQLYV